MQQSTEHVRYLKSTTLQQFIESTSVVLLSVVMLPISGRCRTFELEFKKVNCPKNSPVLLRLVLSSEIRLLMLCKSLVLHLRKSML